MTSTSRLRELLPSPNSDFRRPPHPRDQAAADRGSCSTNRSSTSHELSEAEPHTWHRNARHDQANLGANRLVAEIRAEGIAMVDPATSSTDVRMPEVGTDGHIALLVTEISANRVRTTIDPAAQRSSCTRWCASSRATIRRTRQRSARDPGPRSRLWNMRWSGSRHCASSRLQRRHPSLSRARTGSAWRRRHTASRRPGACVSGLPVPTRERWQAAAAGGVDLFYYDQESSPSATGDCCCGATTAPASRRCSR